jgi:HlyD family secretion protein
MKQLMVLFIFIQLLHTACGKKKQNILTLTLKHSDYYETIDAIGTIQAVSNLSLLAPRVNVSGVTVAHLADEGTHVNKGDTICILEAPELVSIIESFKTDLEKLEADMKKLEADNAMELSLLNAQVETNKAQIAITMLDSIQIKFATPVKQRLLALEMEKANIEKKKLQKKFVAQKRIDNSEMIQMKSRIMMQKNRIQTYETQNNSLKLVAPCDGIVMHYESPEIRFFGGGVGTRGGKIEEKSSVWSNMPLLQIPDMKEMQVSVEVPETDYKRIKNGQIALIRIEASANLCTTGKVKRKTLAGKSAQEKTSIKSYEVIISIDSCHKRMKPGLSATCQIIVDNVKDTIVVPAAAIFGIDSTKVVYVENDGKFIPVTVETGLSNSSVSIISKGLTGNETVALMEPPHNLIRRKEKTETDTTLNSHQFKKDSLRSSVIRHPIN